MVDLGAFGGTYSSASAINERGEIVGTRRPNPAVEGMKDGYPYKAYPVLWRNGQVTALPELTVAGCDGNVDWDFLLGLDDRSRIVGTVNFSTENSTCSRAAVWFGGRWKVLPGLDRAIAFNERGQIIGSGGKGSGSGVWGDGKASDLGTLGGKGTEAAAINERGQIVGTSETADGASHAFVWVDGALTDLGTLGGKRSWAAAINERGQIVGTSETADGASHAFLWDDGELTDLGALPGATTSAVTAINNNGQIIGSSDDHAVLWTLLRG